MCPVAMAVAQAGLGIVSGVMAYQGQVAAADAQREHAQQTATNANTAAVAQYDNLNIRAVQEDMATNQQKQEQNIAVAQAESTTRVAASEGGVSGLSVDHVLRDFYAQAGRRSSAIDTNQQMSRGYLQGEKKSAQAAGQSQANSVPLPETPSFAPHLVNIFSTGLGAYSDYKKNTLR